MNWKTIQAMVSQLKELEYNVDQMSVSQIMELYIKIKTEEGNE